MEQQKKAYMNWSSGKDASLALFHLQEAGSLSIQRLLTSVNAHYNRVSMHGLRVELLQQQAQALGIPLDLVQLSESPSMEDYNRLMGAAIESYHQQGFRHCAFGDIFLEDLKQYRESQLSAYGIQASFPLWKEDTSALVKELIHQGFKAILICIDAQKLDESFLGREIDAAFLDDLPPDVDPCGENGEFHTFCYDGPIFSHPIPFIKGERILRTYEAPAQADQAKSKTPMGFWFLDLLPLSADHKNIQTN